MPRFPGSSKWRESCAANRKKIFSTNYVEVISAVRLLGFRMQGDFFLGDQAQ